MLGLEVVDESAQHHYLRARDSRHHGVTTRKCQNCPAREAATSSRTPRSSNASAIARATRKHTVEPVFGQIKQARGFRQLLLRGLDKARGEWALICTAHNLLKLARAAA